MRTCELTDYFPRALRYFFVGAQATRKCRKYEKRHHNIWGKDKKQMARENWDKLGQGTWEKECKKVEDGEEIVTNKQGDGLWEEEHKEHGN